VAGETRWIAAEDAGRYREAMGASLPIGLPDLFLDAGAEPLESLLRRFARTHVPFVTSDPARRWALSAQSVEAALTGLAARGDGRGGLGWPRLAGRHRRPRRPVPARRRSATGAAAGRTAAVRPPRTDSVAPRRSRRELLPRHLQRVRRRGRRGDARRAVGH